MTRACLVERAGENEERFVNPLRSFLTPSFIPLLLSRFLSLSLSPRERLARHAITLTWSVTHRPQIGLSRRIWMPDGPQDGDNIALNGNFRAGARPCRVNVKSNVSRGDRDRVKLG